MFSLAGAFIFPFWEFFSFFKNMKIKHIAIVLALVLIVLALFWLPAIQISYKIRSQGMVYPVREWVLSKADNGLLVHTLHDHYHNTLAHHAITEFQRGDHGEFLLHPGVFASARISHNDTIGFLRSNEEQRLLIELQGQLEVNRRLLQSYAAGERPEDVSIARERMLLAEKEYETEKKLMERADGLFREEVISKQDHELAQNQYQIKQMSLQIARSEYLALQAGAKPEQLELVRAEIRALESQIEQVSNRLSAFTIKAPFDGIILREGPELSTSETILRLADDSSFIVMLPVETYQLPYLQRGQTIILTPENRASPATAVIETIGNSVHLINRRQHVFITASLHQGPPHILPRMLLQAEIDTGKISLREYAARITKTIYAN